MTDLKSKEGAPGRAPSRSNSNTSSKSNGKDITDGGSQSNGADPALTKKLYEDFLATLPPSLRVDAKTAWEKVVRKQLEVTPALQSYLPDVKVINSGELLKKQFSPLVWIVPDLLPAGLTILAGRPKVGKSWLALQIAQAVATGGKVFDHDIVKGRVLYLALEDNQRRLQERMKHQGWPTGNEGADFILADTFREQFETLNSGGGARLAKHIQEADYRFVIIDTLSRAFKGDQRDEAEMTAAIAPLQETALRLEIAILLIDHHRKGLGGFEPNAVDDILGSTAKAAIVDGNLGLYKEQGKRGAKLLISGREVTEATLKLIFDPEFYCWQCEGEAGGVEKTERRTEILDALSLLGQTQLKGILEVIGQDKSNTFHRLQDLVNANQVVCTEVGGKNFYSLPRLTLKL